MINKEDFNKYYICIYLDEENVKRIGLFKKSEELITKTKEYTIYIICYTDIFSKRELEIETNKTFKEINKNRNGGILNCTTVKSIPLTKIFSKKKKISIKEVAIALYEIWKQVNQEEINIEEMTRLIEDNIDKVQFKGRTEEYNEPLGEIAEKSNFTM